MSEREDRCLSCLKGHLAGSPRLCDEYRMLGAVNAILSLYDINPTVVLLRRAENPFDPWSGDLCLPGGRVEAGETVLETVYRETFEEVHLTPKDYDVIGFLPPAASRSVPGVCVVPAVSVRASGILPRIGPEATSLYYLNLIGDIAVVERFLPKGRRVVSGYGLGLAEVVWGLTYRILGELVSLLRRCARACGYGCAGRTPKGTSAAGGR